MFLIHSFGFLPERANDSWRSTAPRLVVLGEALPDGDRTELGRHAVQSAQKLLRTLWFERMSVTERTPSV